MRISVWSSDVCSSDLQGLLALDEVEQQAFEGDPPPLAREAVRQRHVQIDLAQLDALAVEAGLLRHHLDADILFGLQIDDHHIGVELCRADAGEDIVRHRLELDQHFGLALRHALRSEEHTSELQSLMRISYT